MKRHSARQRPGAALRGACDGRVPSKSAMRRAFTLIEVLLVLALIGLFTTLFMVNLESLMRETEAGSVETAFWSATRDARTRALVDREPQLVRFDAKAAAFVVEAARSQRTRRVTIDRSRWAEDGKGGVAL